MTLEALGGGGYDYLQDSTPSNPSIGDTWLDTSTDPPISKVYADLGGGGQWTTDLLDSPVSNAGASIADIESGAEDALEEDISNLSPASNSVAGQLDGGVSGGVDWASKTPKVDKVSPNGSLSISASGYLTGLFPAYPSYNVVKAEIKIDGTLLQSSMRVSYSGGATSISLLHRFDSLATISETNGENGLYISYVLD